MQFGHRIFSRTHEPSQDRRTGLFDCNSFVVTEVDAPVMLVGLCGPLHRRPVHCKRVRRS